MHNKKILFSITAVIFFAITAYATYYALVLRFLEKTDNAYVKADSILISPKINGYVAEVAVQDNQEVHSGAALVQIEASDYTTKLEQQIAALRSQEAALVTLNYQKILQRSKIYQAEATLRSFDAQQSKAAMDYERSLVLFSKGFITKEQGDSSRTVANMASAGVDRAKAELQETRDQLTVLTAREAQIRADIEQNAAVVKSVQLDLHNSTLIAPINGFIGNKMVEVGQYVKAGTQLMMIVPLDKAYIVANFKETQIRTMRPGQKVQINIDAYSNTVLEGVIESIAPATGSEFSLLPPENATGNFTKIVQRVPVRIAILPGHVLGRNIKPGMSVSVTVDTRESLMPARYLSVAKPAPRS